MGKLTRPEVVAMWVWHEEYARSGLGAIEFFKRLDPSRVRVVADFIKQYEAAR
ncbi:MAG TPA: hypothetical protein VGQ44_17095 [Gemmatimonadaceae bacterium]|jgi:hypothetical protein|nr:hypothetical protein [Gemmatimonadaceae bacterium]